MASTPRKRFKNLNSTSSPSQSLKSSSSLFSENYIPEPSPDFFPSSKPEFLRLIAVITIAASVAVFYNYLFTFFSEQQKPFCDSGIHLEDSLSDYCEPCPNNGTCHEGELECARGYKRQGKLCIEDKDTNAAAKALSKLVEVRICEAYGQYLCSGTGYLWVQEDELWSYLDKCKVMENHGLDEATYIHAKLKALATSRELLEKRSNTGGFEEFKCPDSLVEYYKPISCRIRQWITEHALVLVSVCALLVGCILILIKVHRSHCLSVRAEELYNQVCDILEENALNSRSMTGEGEPWVVASWLRDYLLSPKERKDPNLWKKVEELVQEDSRLDRYPKMVKGEPKEVWECQGSLNSSGKKLKIEDAQLKSRRCINSTSNQRSWELEGAKPLNC